MSLLGLMITGIAATCLLSLIAYGWVDSQLRRDHRQAMAIRDWQEKVQAMRRIHDEEGEA